MDLPSNVTQCTCDTCEEGGCGLQLPRNLREQIEMVDLNCVKTRLGQAGDTADCGIVWKQKNWVAVVELKGGKNLKFSAIVNQLQGGLDALATLLDGQATGPILPILLYEGKDPTAGFDGYWVEFRGQRHRIRPYECGTSLATIISFVRQ